jgi:hypothetical protein
VPLRRCVVPLLAAFVPWLLVVLGRALCLAAQRIPVLVRLVRALRRWSEGRCAQAAAQYGAEGGHLGARAQAGR